MKVLIIDDEEDVRYIARLSLSRFSDMTVVEATSGREGLAAAEREQPDCILLDMMMPGMDGEQTFAALRRSDAVASIPVVFLTAVAATEEVQRVLALGAAGLIRKPFDPKALAGQIKAFIE
jgi:CheY-like chemotaxis protein